MTSRPDSPTRAAWSRHRRRLRRAWASATPGGGHIRLSGNACSGRPMDKGAPACLPQTPHDASPSGTSGLQPTVHAPRRPTACSDYSTAASAATIVAKIARSAPARQSAVARSRAGLRPGATGRPARRAGREFRGRAPDAGWRRINRRARPRPCWRRPARRSFPRSRTGCARRPWRDRAPRRPVRSGCRNGLRAPPPSLPRRD